MSGIVLLAGCWAPMGGDDDEPSATNPNTVGQLLPVVAPGAGPLGGDLVMAGQSPDAGSPEADALSAAPNFAATGEAEEELVEAPGDPGTSGPPKVFYLAYADGSALPRTNPNPCQSTAPKFVCEFASNVTECQRQIQTYLDRWYADYNVIFTLKRPTSGAFYTEVISSGGGAWCDAASNVAGIAPFLCEDLRGGVAYTFLGGKSAKETAIIIAQEQAHLVGLEHTSSGRDIMDPTICPNCDGFEDADNKIPNDHCSRSRQNSHQMMKDRLGVWTGGIKPTPFGCQPDDAPPLAQILTPADGAAVGDNFVLRVQASDKCKVSHVTVSVMPMGLKSQSSAAPFEWTLAKISGRQTITVTAFDSSGKQSSASVTVRAGNLASGTGGSSGSGGRAGGGAGSSGSGTGGAADNADNGMAPQAELTTDAETGCQVAGCGVAGKRGSGSARDGTTSGAMWALSLALVGLLLRARSSRRARVRASSVARRAAGRRR